MCKRNKSEVCGVDMSIDCLASKYSVAIGRFSETDLAF